MESQFQLVVDRAEWVNAQLPRVGRLSGRQVWSASSEGWTGRRLSVTYVHASPIRERRVHTCLAKTGWRTVTSLQLDGGYMPGYARRMPRNSSGHTDRWESVREGSGRARDLARALATALDLKDDSHYGTLMIGTAELRRLIRVAEVLVSAALEVT